jgi:hypothetical protein
MATDGQLSPGRKAYEARRAEKAGKSLDAWLSEKQRRQAAATKPAAPLAPPKKPGLISRLLDRAHKPL